MTNGTADPEGMDTEAFKALGAELFGNGWQTRLARALGVDGSTVRRWVGGAVPLPPQIGAFLRMMRDRQEIRGAYVFETQAIGGPLPVDAADAGDVAWMAKRLVFPGVEQAKPMPAINCHEEQGTYHLSLDGSEADRPAQGISYILTRHPDPHHLAGYLDAARRRGHAVATMRNRFHHYTAIAHQAEAAAGVVHQISTHAGTLRTLHSRTASPMDIEGRELSALPGAGGEGED